MENKTQYNSLKTNFSKILVACGVFLQTATASAITLDAFNFTAENMQGQQTRLNSGNVGQTTSLVQNFGGAYGGTRSTELTASHVGQSSFSAFAQRAQIGIPSFYSIANSFSSAGDVLLTYDGNSTAGLNNYRGLCNGSSCLNLRDGNASALALGVWYDYAFNQSVDLVFTFYDSSDITGNTYSRGTVTIDRRYDNNSFTDLFLPFTSLTQSGSGGAANLTNIGAFSLAVNGAGRFAYDLGLTNFRTNATSTAVPEPSTIALLIMGALGISRRKNKI